MHGGEIYEKPMWAVIVFGEKIKAKASFYNRKRKYADWIVFPKVSTQGMEG